MALNYRIDPISSAIGMINCFVEMVACGVKPLAISPPVDPADLPVLEDASRCISEAFHTKYEIVDSLIITDIQPAAFTKGKRSILYYEDDSIIETYRELERRVGELEVLGRYEGTERRDISIRFGRLLGYPEKKILEKVDGDRCVDPFVLKSV